MTRATRPARTGTARPSARKARGRPLSYMSQRYASARPVAGKKPCLNTGWMFAMELTPDLGAARGRANGRRYHRAAQHRLPTASTDAFWARPCLISRAGVTGNSRATLPFVALSRLCEVGARICRSRFKLAEARKFWGRSPPSQGLGEVERQMTRPSAMDMSRCRARVMR